MFFILLSLSFVIRRPHEYGNRLLFATLMEKEGLMERETGGEVEYKEVKRVRKVFDGGETVT